MPPPPLFGDPRLPARFWSRVYVNPDTECWEWTGTLDKQGYGNNQATYKVNGKWRHQAPHRWAYEALVGPIPEETLNHKCRVRHCVNPSPKHAGDPMSLIDNVKDAKANTTQCPQGHPYDYENTMIREQSLERGGYRRECRQCMRDRSAAYKAANREKVLAQYKVQNDRRAAAKRADPAPPKPPPPPKTHCVNGHEWNEINVGGSPGKQQFCRVCLREGARQRAAAKAATG